jgi:hypothetical protein
MNMPDWLKRVQENMAKSSIQQLFADEALVLGTVKAGKTKDGKVKKESSVRIAFIDMTSMQPVAKIVITLSTAKGLINALSSQIGKLEQDLETDELPEKLKREPVIKDEPSLTYIG